MNNSSIREYFNKITEQVNELYQIAKKARSLGLDPQNFPEVIPAEDVASRIEGLLGPPGIGKRIRELLEKFDRETVAFKITEELIMGKFGYMSDEMVADKALRVALAILTEGITAGPLEGIAEVKIKKNADGSKYLAIYYASPIRAAGGTEAAQTVLIGDYIRQLLHLNRYIPTRNEINRYVEEIELYERYVTHLQYPSTKEEIEYATSHLPIEITGEPTDSIEVSGYRDLPRVETNRLRGGAILVINDGVIGRAHKLLKIVESQKIQGWNWLEKLVEMKRSGKTNGPSESTIEPDYKYLSDVIAGRPVFSYPSRVGGFRLRYGRSRNTGLSAVGMHPATMFVLKEFIAPGTHIRIERPGKGAIVLPVTTIMGPIVRLKNGSVIKLDSVFEAKRLSQDIDSILFLGDILIAFGEFLENNHKLVPSSYVEEWWVEELKAQIKKVDLSILENTNISSNRIMELTSSFECIPTFSEAFVLAKKLNIPLHPKYTYFWNNISVLELIQLRNYLLNNYESLKKKQSIPYNDEIKQILEKIFVEHKLQNGNIIFKKVDAAIFCITLNLSKNIILKESNMAKTSLDLIQLLSNITLKNVGTVFIGARMGRPEKAKARKMSPPVHMLFPLGGYGGKSRKLADALNRKRVVVEVITRFCPKCNTITPEPFCRSCNTPTENIFYCPTCKISTTNNKCPRCNAQLKPFAKIELDLEQLFKKIHVNKSPSVIKKVKGVIGLTSANKIPELPEKGILRAIHDVYVFKDGTTRFDCTDAPLTHFKPKEIGISVDKLKELGYLHDYLGKPLQDENQIVELKVQDIVISKNGLKYLLNVSHFVDDLLEKVYNLPRYYNAHTIDDLIGHLVIGLAPHTSAGIIGRIIGYTNASVGFAHPFWHAAKRRNCDGDEDSVILLLDALLNFSKSFLPKKRGGMMDAPLVLTIRLNPLEIDDESWNMDICSNYPLEFYTLSHKFVNPKDVVNLIDIVEKRLGTEAQYSGFYFTHNTDQIDLGPKETAYKRYETMQEKLDAQLYLAEIIGAVNANDVAKKVLISHFLPDILGSLRSFATQGFRCVNCNKKYRRPPLAGHCLSCGGKLILTVHKGTVVKYLAMAKSLVDKYHLDNYLKQRLLMVEQSINSIFSNAEEPLLDKKQVKLSDFLD